MSETPIDEMQTPLTDELYRVVIAKSGVPMANSPYHKLREHAAKMERALARRDALLREIIGYKFCPNDVKERISIELGEK